MGCPDWPKCFDQWVPPTELSDLPEDYKERFKRGSHEVADFNVFHTWTEYVNRLVGVLIGLFIAITMVSSFQFRKTEPKITVYAVLSFVLVGFQGWIGKVVVDKNLAGWMVTIHMLIALVVVAMVMLAVFRHAAPKSSIDGQNSLRNLSMIALVLTLIQITVGTQVRERVDEVLIHQLAPNWIDHAGSVLRSHVILSFLLMGVIIALWYQAKKGLRNEGGLKKVLNITLLFSLIQILSGIANRWMDLPAISQMSHILFGTLMAGGFYYLWMVLNRKSTSQEVL